MSDLETTNQLTPRFDASGLIAAIAQDHATGEVLMLAWMNAEALRLTLETGQATYWSRSRQRSPPFLLLKSACSRYDSAHW